MARSNITEFVLAVDEAGRRMPAEAVKLAQRRAGLAMFDQIIRSTPVLTGRLRGEWQATINTPASSPTNKTDRSGESTKAAGFAALANIPDFAVVWFTNAMPYAETVDSGGYLPKDPPDDPASNAARASRRTRLQLAKAKAVAGDEGAPLVAGGFSLQAPAGISALAIEVGVEALRQS
jgi:hypothetical protein